MKTNEKICLLCYRKYFPNHHSQKYCGDYFVNNTCAWKARRLRLILGSMKDRCFNPNNANYKYYKKIKICNEWVENASNFFIWAINNGWEKGLFIDRENNLKGYSPSNCRFVDIQTSNRNKSNCVTNWDEKTRRCRVCKNIKSFDDFMISRKEIGGIAYECTECRKGIDRIKYIRIKNEKKIQHEI